jgi:AmiR/NasT family two-component response regulator
VFAAAAVEGPRRDGAGSQLEAGRTVVLIGGRDSELVRQAADRGIAPLVPAAATLDEALALALKQAEELDRLRTVSTRLATVERAKGVLMERHKVSEHEAHEKMRRHARKLNVKLTDVAEAVLESYLLLPREDG